MPKCPECKGDITHLRAFSTEQNEQEVYLQDSDSGFWLDWGVSEVVEGTCIKIDFECPECGEVIFSNKGDSCDSRILAFLEGKEIDRDKEGRIGD